MPPMYPAAQPKPEILPRFSLVPRWLSIAL